MPNDPSDRSPRIPPKTVAALLRVLQFLVASAGFFAWWMAVLLLISLIAVNVWHVSFEQILFLSLGLTGVSAAAYLFIMLRRAKKSSDGR